MFSDDIYKEFFISLYKNPKNYGKLKEYDIREGLGNPSCGDTIVYYIKLEGDKIKDISFEGKGCVVSIVSASLLSEEVKGKKLEEIEKMEAKDLFDIIGIDLSKNPTRAKCALLSLSVLKNAIKKIKK